MARKAWSFKSVLQNDPCAFCGGSGGTVDHIHPRSKGGPNNWINYTGSCMKCNTRKGSRSLLGFILDKPELGYEVTVPPVDNNYYFPLHKLLKINPWDGQPEAAKKEKGPRQIEHACPEEAAAHGARYIADRNGLTRLIKLDPKQRYVEPQWVVKERVRQMLPSI